MWFKRKPKNRRLGREFVLDVKLRSSQVRAARARMAAVALGIVFATVFGVYLLWRGSEWTLNRLVYENQAFVISEIKVQTDGVIAPDQLRRWSGVRTGQNLLALDLARVKRDLELVPAIQNVAIERILPHTLCLRVVEREPVAQINITRPKSKGGIELAVFYVDAEGYVMLPLEPHQRTTPASQPVEPMPILDGINANEVQAGRRLESPQVQAALQLIVAFERSPMAGLVDLKRIDVSAPESLQTSTGQGSEVAFGLADPEQQLRRWREIFDQGQKLNKVLASLDLAVSNNIPARWLEASVTPPAPAPKLPKPLRSNPKKKHV
ncbi:MAG TPA: FtsQ-type POTRA domain-containing protein [Candidatus Sulfotelmatobacter sp.]|nr:FtsQ-type POTRA domain-containing protein [Candidatus Sulfotelmatobacter sp.]HWI60014.1 FtsQ-type POTRA domain-containing protein [Bacillota bacterium]